MKNLKVNNFNVTTGDNAGEVNLSWDAVKSAELYVVQLSGAHAQKNSNEKWEVCDIVNESFYTVGGLKKNRKYSFRVAAVSSRKQGPWSSKIERAIE